MYIYILFFYTCITINIKDRPREQKCVFVFSKKYSSGARHVRDLRAWNSREKKIEIRASSSIVTGTFAASTLTGVKKVPYNIIYFLTYELGAEPFFFFINFFFFLRMHKYHNRSRFIARLRMCHVYAYAFHALYILIIPLFLLLLLSSPFKIGNQRNAVFASFVSLSKFRSKARFGSSNDSRDPKSSLWNFVLTRETQQRTLQNLSFLSFFFPFFCTTFFD